MRLEVFFKSSKAYISGDGIGDAYTITGKIWPLEDLIYKSCNLVSWDGLLKVQGLLILHWVSFFACYCPTVYTVSKEEN